MEEINKYFQKMYVPLSKVVGFGSDGAAVMLGSKNGVATKLREVNPFLLSCHCIAHRFALCTAQGASKVSIVKHFVETLTSLYYFFQHSAVRCSKLQSVQEALKEPVLSIKEVHSVRWLAFFNALDTVFRCWSSIIQTLEHEASNQGKGNPKAHGLFKAMTKFDFVATMHFLMDFVPHMQRVSKTFQRAEVNFSVILPIVDSTIQALQEFSSSHGPHLSKFLTNANSGEGCSNTNFCGTKLSDSPQQRSAFQKAKSDFIGHVYIQLICERGFLPLNLV